MINYTIIVIKISNHINQRKSIVKINVKLLLIIYLLKIVWGIIVVKLNVKTFFVINLINIMSAILNLSMIIFKFYQLKNNVYY